MVVVDFGGKRFFIIYNILSYSPDLNSSITEFKTS